MSETFRIEEGTPWVGGKSYPWAREVFEDVAPALFRRCGFHLAMENGWVVSVQWGTGNYCANRDALFRDPGQEVRPFLPDCPDAEVGVFDDSGKLGVLGLPDEVPGWHDSVTGWRGPTEVRAIIRWIGNWDTGEVPSEPMNSGS